VIVYLRWLSCCSVSRFQTPMGAYQAIKNTRDRSHSVEVSIYGCPAHEVDDEVCSLDITRSATMTIWRHILQ
jgi:hypothetical protein